MGRITRIGNQRNLDEGSFERLVAETARAVDRLDQEARKGPIVLRGKQDGSNKSFRTPEPFVRGKSEVTRNGLVQVRDIGNLTGDYAEPDDRTVRFNTAPSKTDDLKISYLPLPRRSA